MTSSVYVTSSTRETTFSTTSTHSKFLTNTESNLSLLSELTKTISPLDPGFTRKSAYDTLIAGLCKLNRVDASLELIKSMAAQSGLDLNAVSFHPILSVLTRSKKVDDAWRVIELMKESGVSPDLTVLTRHCYDGDLTATVRVLEKMEEKKMGADSRTYNALVFDACRTGKVEAAIVLLMKMEDDGLPALYSTCAHVIGALLDMDHCEQAIEFVRVCGGRDLKLDTETFGILASMLIKKNRDREAMDVLEEIKKGLRFGQKLQDFYYFNVE